MPSGITKNSAGAATPTVGISDRNDYCVEEIDIRVTEWMEDLTNNDGVMKSYVDIAKDVPLAGTWTSSTESTTVNSVAANGKATTQVDVGAILKTSTGTSIGTVASITDDNNIKLTANAAVSIAAEVVITNKFISAYDNFVAKRASVLSASYDFITEFLRIKNFIKPYRTAFWAEEEAVNTELERLEGIKADYQDEVDYFQGLIDGDPSSPDAGDWETARDTQSANVTTTENYRADVKTDADAIFGQFNGTSNTGQTAEAASAVNKEIEDILEAIFFAIVRSCQLIGTKPAVEDVFGTTIGSTETDTPVALLSYFDRFTKLIESKDTVNTLDGYTFDLTPFQNVSDNIVGLDLGEATASYKDVDGNDAIATYPVLNAAADAKVGLLTAYLNSGVGAYYFGDDQDTLSSMTSQVLNAKNAVETQLGNLEALPVANQATDWDTDLVNLETARTQYSSWTFISQK
jgi:uncharacterized lipoprotein YajG